MKKWKTTIPDGGLKYFNKFLAEQGGKEIFDAMEAIFEDFSSETEGFILKGGVAAGTSPNATITESIVVLNGKLLRLEAATGLTFPFFIVEATTVSISEAFDDETTKPVIDNEFAEVVASDPGGVQIITIPATGTFQKGGFTKRMVEDNGAILKIKVIEIGDWDMDASPDQFVVSHGITDAKTKIRSIQVTIRDDNDAIYTDLQSIDASGNVNGGILDASGWTDTNITLVRTLGGFFDDVLYDDFGGVQGNRGFILITYEE